MKLLSLNIRQGGGKRFEQIKSYLSFNNFDVLLLQEFRDNATGKLIKEYLTSIGFQYAYNYTDKTQNTVLTAAKELKKINTPTQVNKWSCLITEINSIRVINVYFPQRNYKKVVFEFLMDIVKDNKSTLVAGDFNTGNNELDSEGAKFICANEFNILSDEILNDAYRIHNNTQKDYSWYSNKGNGFRVDHILVSDDIKNKIISVKYDQSTRKGVSDHAAMLADISINNTVSLLIEMLNDGDQNFECKFIDYVSKIDTFDWMSWSKGLNFFKKSTNQNLCDFEKSELERLLLLVVRVDRFNNGFLSKQKNNGNLLSILKKL